MQTLILTIPQSRKGSFIDACKDLFIWHKLLRECKSYARFQIEYHRPEQLFNLGWKHENLFANEVGNEMKAYLKDKVIVHKDYFQTIQQENA